MLTFFPIFLLLLYFTFIYFISAYSISAYSISTYFISIYFIQYRYFIALFVLRNVCDATSDFSTFICLSKSQSNQISHLTISSL